MLPHTIVRIEFLIRFDELKPLERIRSVRYNEGLREDIQIIVRFSHIEIADSTCWQSVGVNSACWVNGYTVI